MTTTMSSSAVSSQVVRPFRGAAFSPGAVAVDGISRAAVSSDVLKILQRRPDRRVDHADIGGHAIRR
jgi:hypothetical protein